MKLLSTGQQAYQRYRRVLGIALPRAAVWVATLAAAGLLFSRASAAAAVLVIATMAFLIWWRTTRVGADRHLVSRAVLTVLLAGAGAELGQPGLWLITAGVMIVLLMAEPLIGFVTRPVMSARNLPGLRQPPLARIPEPVFLAGGVALCLIAAHQISLAPLIAAGLALASAVIGLGLAGYQLVRERRKSSLREIRTALIEYRPSYAWHFHGTTQGAYQLRMWLPYLERTGERGILIARDPRFSSHAAGIDNLPVILVRSTEALEQLIVPGLRTFFYVNNHARNADGVRFGGLTHVHLGHGDSEKPASYAATTAMFDRIFVAGQAGVDRFARHGVLIPREKFVLVGRPQVEHLQVRPESTTPPAQPVVLYAPTWRGSLGDSLFGSLRSGESIVRALLRAGATVWFRPHPYDYRDAASRVLINRIDTLLAADPSRPHRSSEQTREDSVFDCLNASDALVTDISSIASDYLYTNKPFALVDTGVAADVDSTYPLVKAAYLLSTAADLDMQIAAFLGEDRRGPARAEIRNYYLGGWPAADYADVFVTAARAAMSPN